MDKALPEEKTLGAAINMKANAVQTNQRPKLSGLNCMGRNACMP
jgi:hypothetical protein